MPHRHRLPCLFLSLLLLLTHPLSVSALPRSLPKAQQTNVACADLDITGVSAQSAVLIDADSGQVLYQKNADERLPMASTTKIMTALCAVELADVGDVITVDARAVGIEGSSAYLQKGEKPVNWGLLTPISTIRTDLTAKSITPPPQSLLLSPVPL